MRLVLTDSIRKAEFEPLEKTFSLEVIKIAAKKCLEGLGKEIKSSTKVPSTSLKKLNLTSTGGAGRAAFLLQIRHGKAILVMVRPKNDKKIGANMSIENPNFKKTLEKNLCLLMADIENANFEEFEL